MRPAMAVPEEMKFLTKFFEKKEVKPAAE